MPQVTLVGYRGSGKSSVAAAIAARLGCSWCDADDMLERETGRSIAEFIREQGEPAFRDAEAELLGRLLAAEAGVVATGGGVVLREENRRLLRRLGPPVVWLSAPPEVLRRRLAADPATASRRPALGGGDVLDEVALALARREPLYREVADGVVDGAIDPLHRIAERITAWRAAWVPAGAGLCDNCPEPIP
ncbi:MAG: shikimate kinase [Pirellulales bacterium]